jgi:transcriptional regulator GlxA family with amidase domain
MVKAGSLAAASEENVIINENALSMSKMQLKQEDVDKILEAKRILDKEYYRHYTHEDLAQMVGTNEYKLKAGFKQLTQKTIYEYLTWVRIERVKYLLETTDLPLKIIATKVGLDKSNLNKCFKKGTTLTPMEYRRQHRGNHNMLTHN